LTRSIWKILYYHNIGRWPSNVLSIYNTASSLAGLLLVAQIILGIWHFYDTVNAAIGHAAIIHLSLNGNYIITPPPGSSYWSFWKPGQTLVIAPDTVDFFSTFTRALFIVFGYLAAYLLKNELFASRQASKLEIESRWIDYQVLLECTLERRFLVRVASF